MDSVNNVLQNTTSIKDKLNSENTTNTNKWFEFFKTKNFLIVLLIIIILLLFLGINLFNISGNILSGIINALRPLISSILLLFGVSINTIGNLFDGIGDIFSEILHIFGNNINFLSGYKIENNNNSNNSNQFNNGNNNNSNQFNNGNQFPIRDGFVPNDTNNVEQSGIQQKNKSWCLIGDTISSRTCVPIEDSMKCMSGMVYDSEEKCLTPIITDDNPITKTTSGNGNNNKNQDAGIIYPSNGLLNKKEIMPITSLPDGTITSKNKTVENIKTTYPTTFSS
jgi:hypothetical protein